VATAGNLQTTDCTDGGEANSTGIGVCERNTVATKRQRPAEDGEGSGPPKRARKKCRHEGCTNHAKVGGVCIKHVAKVKTCRHGGCANKIVKGGVCVKHGAKRNTCRHDGCTNIIIQGGVCVKHGVKVKRKKCRTMAIPATLKKMESAEGMGQRQNNVAARDVQALPEN
jgi:hypothetical protein